MQTIGFMRAARFGLFLAGGAHAVGCGGEGYEAGNFENVDVASAGEELTVSEDFLLGIQLGDEGGVLVGDPQYTGFIEGGTSTSPWACDSNCYRATYGKLELDVASAAGDQVLNKDIRVCLQAADQGTPPGSGAGTMRCTAWASDSGGSHLTGLATDQNAFEPGAYRLQLQVRNWPTNQADWVIDYRFRIRVWDTDGYGPWSTWTGWALQDGGGETSWATDKNGFAPDAMEVEMGVNQTVVDDFCTPSHKCQNGFGDCDTANDCKTGSSCVFNVGNQYGYFDNSIDVCVDSP